jgi:hypothetical protein
MGLVFAPFSPIRRSISTNVSSSPRSGGLGSNTHEDERGRPAAGHEGEATEAVRTCHGDKTAATGKRLKITLGPTRQG